MASVSAVATAASNCLRAQQPPTLMTRTWLVYPPSLHYRAGKSPRLMKSLAYRVFADYSIKRSVNPYTISHSPAPSHMFASSFSAPRRAFHTSSSRFAKNTNSAIPHISLHIAAASSGKGSKYEADKSTMDFVPSKSLALGVQSGDTVFQKRRSRPDSGEDAYFVAAVAQGNDAVAMAVCDGVGGWQEQGINPSDFSHGLCSYMANHALNWSQIDPDPTSINPKKLLTMGYDEVLADKSIRAGGATACVAVADTSGRLRTANLGDSGFLLLRLGSVQQSSHPQTHAFNTPYQMSKTPPEILTQAAIFGGLPLNDAPDRADVADTQLQHGDVVVFATDGVWDNLSAQDILGIVSRIMRENGAWDRPTGEAVTVTDNVAALTASASDTTNSQNRTSASLQSMIASHIVGEAKVASRDQKRDGPFAKAVQREYPMEHWHGGKVDDITALVLIAVESSTKKPEPLKSKL